MSGVRIREKRECLGEIYPDGVYTVSRVMELIGLGRMSIADATAAGVVKKHLCGNRVYVKGQDVIDWITKHDAHGEIK